MRRTKDYMLILGTRVGEDKRLMTGRLVKFTSEDLDTWDSRATGGIRACTPCSRCLISLRWATGGIWCSPSTVMATRPVTACLASINGPWITPADDSFDGRAYYAARTAFDGERRVLFGWVPTRDEGGDPSSYLWGGTFMPLEIVQRADGTLGTKLPDSMLGAFGEAKAVEAFELSCESGKVGQEYSPRMPVPPICSIPTSSSPVTLPASR